MSRPTHAETFLAIAAIVAHRSHCGKRQVGCVITDDRGQRIAVGYNGLAAGGSNFCGVTDPMSKCDCIHAEANAAVKAQWHGPKIAYVTAVPCRTCEALLVNAGVVEIVSG
jgi:dCMP deaminase